MTAAEDKALDEQAAFWFARLRADDVADHDRARFSEWLAEDARHPEIYAGYEALWDAVGGASASEAILGMRAQALASVRRRTRPPWRRIAAVAASLAVLTLGGLLVLRPGGGFEIQESAPVLTPAAPAPSVYATEVGERSTIVLDDGSTVVLNTDSVLQVSYDERRRRLRLLHGQAVFEVAQDAGRPFVVEAGGQTITALGTIFDVHVDGEETRVTLIEGSIAVERKRDGLFAGPAEVSRLTAGQALVALPTQPFQVQAANLDRTVGWRSGRVNFSNEPLSEVLEEINRYSTRQVVLGDADLAGLRVSGAFNTGSAERFVAALELGFPVEAQRDEARDVIVLRRR